MPPEIEDFAARVRWLVGQIPPGRVATYGQIAHLAGAPRAARAAGNVLRGSLGEDVPWQRVINARGEISFKGDLGRAETQRRLLRAEGIAFDGWGCALETHEWDPDQLYWSADWDDPAEDPA